MRFVHTADWQIGKVFRRFGDREALFREARLAAVETLGRLATREGAPHVLVAGDVYDSEVPAKQTLLAPIERMRRFPNVVWHLLPGNHDPHRPKGLWDALRGQELPANVMLCLAAEPVEIEPHVFLLPAPLTRKAETSDLTAWMDAAPTPPGALRLGLAHGAVVGFDPNGEATNPIDPTRPAKAGLDYLALGDWHRTLRVGPRVWYSGTPEPDRAGSQEIGTALLVDIAGAGAEPVVRQFATGCYQWRRVSDTLSDETSVRDLETRLRALDASSNLVLRLDLSGVVTMAARARLEEALPRLEAAFCHLEADLEALHTRPSQEDLDALAFDGVLSRVAAKLKDRIADPRASADDVRAAEDALVRLFLQVEAQAPAARLGSAA